VFAAEGGKYGDALELCTRDTSGWCQDAFAAFSSADDFKQCRGHRGDPTTWRPNHNGRVLLPGVLAFANQLPFFDPGHVGKVAIIVNELNSRGVEHVDHRFDDLVSEFVWVRTQSSTKRFFVRDPATQQKHFVGQNNNPSKLASDSEDRQIDPTRGVSEGCGGGGAAVCWFDDHLPHCLEQRADGPQFSLRIDGRFTPAFRAFVAAVGRFGVQSKAGQTEGGLAGVLLAASAGPVFLQQENPEPEMEDEDEEEEENDDASEDGDEEAEAQ
jgi:hypothetical protein